MTRDEIMQMDGDTLRLAVARALGVADVDRGMGDTKAAIDLLDSMAYPGEDTRVEYIIIKETYGHFKNIDPLPAPVYFVQIFGRNPVNGIDYEADGDTLALAATRAWLMREGGAK